MSPTLKTALKSKASGTTEKGLERAHDILVAARQIFADEGYAGLSMRRVASEVGMSLSNVQHYYKSKDSLIEALLLYTMNMFQEKIDNIVDSMGNASQIDRFLSTTDMFMEELGDPVTHAVFFEIWALASRDAFASELMDKMLAREKKAIYKLIHGLIPGLSDEQYMQRAVLIIAQVQGLMLFRLTKNSRRAELTAIREAVRRAVLNLATVP